MTDSLVALMVAVPLLTAGFLVVFPARPGVQAVVLCSVLGASTAAAAALVYGFAIDGGGAIGHGIGLWAIGVAIPLVADMFSALMLTVTGLLTLVCAIFAYAARRRANSPYFAPLVLVLTTGVNGALLTADLFNLFVFIEVMLLPSYGLFVLGLPGAAPMSRVRGARLYVTVNLLTSTIFLVGVGFVYGTAGTVNIPELAGAAREDPAVAMSVAICLFALSIKAAVVPVHGWLPRAYPSTSPAVTAMFSGLHTKVAIYAIYRIYAVIFAGDARWLWIGIVAFCATMLIGVLGAVGETTMRSILAFHMVSQIGYILLGVALFTELGLAAGIFYLLHHMIVKASLFLSAGAVEDAYGTGAIGAIGGIAAREPLIAIAFFAAALSLAGIPPFSGFVAKLTLIVAALDAGSIAAVVIMLAVSLITLLSMLKIWSGVFWGRSESAAEAIDATAGSADATAGSADATAGSADATAGSADTTAASSAVTGSIATTVGEQRRIRVVAALPAVALAAVTLGLGLGAELLMGLSTTAATGLLDPTAYVEAVIGS
ncbi:monovalent cation/H+ antiporter subunit D family protein [Millisia brevis]|uniref:monovalent cation/H+ antiporter subunit D family protein n=1 Tax=Millisia brevis TaxID=264148 RepID=UPI000836EDCD|nr:monovalent cation/H+ antiporter subunit D family protein [Millisia brevis]